MPNSTGGRRLPFPHRPGGRRVVLPAILPAALAVLLLVAGCSSIGAVFSGPAVAVNSVMITASDDMNHNSPVAVDLVILYDDSLTERVLGMTAADWFNHREQLRRDFPEGLQVVSWEIVPGQTLPAQPVSRRSGTTAGFLFANYFAPGQHRIRLTDQSQVHVRLLKEAFTISAPAPEASA